MGNKHTTKTLTNINIQRGTRSSRRSHIAGRKRNYKKKKNNKFPYHQTNKVNESELLSISEENLDVAILSSNEAPTPKASKLSVSPLNEEIETIKEVLNDIDDGENNTTTVWMGRFLKNNPETINKAKKELQKGKR